MHATRAELGLDEGEPVPINYLLNFLVEDSGGYTVEQYRLFPQDAADITNILRILVILSAPLSPPVLQNGGKQWILWQYSDRDRKIPRNPLWDHDPKGDG